MTLRWILGLEPSTDRNLFCLSNRFLRSGAAFHSHHMSVSAPRLRSALACSGSKFACQRTTVPLFSTVTGACVSGRKLDAQYWEDNLQKPVKFWDAVVAALSAEVGSGKGNGVQMVRWTRFVYLCFWNIVLDSYRSYSIVCWCTPPWFVSLLLFTSQNVC